MMPVQAGLSDFLSSATNSTTGIPSQVTGIVGRGLGLLWYLVLAGLFGALVYYAAMLAFSENPGNAKDRIKWVIGAIIAVYLLPRVVDWITG